jgi:hypothetical protein
MTQSIPRHSAPPGGIPYHPKEIGAEGGDFIVTKRTGLAGLFFLLLAVWFSVLLFVVASPFILLGLAEFVATTPNSWRVRWIRDDEASQ